jgi:hypothetical protein
MALDIRYVFYDVCFCALSLLWCLPSSVVPGPRATPTGRPARAAPPHYHF